MKLTTFFCLLALACNLYAEERPNIVLVLMDNLGWGELGVYGGGVIRGAETARLDSLAESGMRLLNFNVESQCTPSRAALMTGRYAIRTGSSSVPLGVDTYGLTPWEYTLAEMLSDAGYDTGMFGKWHLGDSKGRYPTDQGFDEWYGIPNSSDESYWPDNDLFREGVSEKAKFSYVMEGKKGKKVQKVKVYDSEQRLMIDRELTDKAKDYITRKVKAKRPFFLYLPYTQPHFPTQPEPSRKGETGNGNWADVLKQIDDYVGELLDTLDSLGASDNTVFIFTSDNGAESKIPHQGFSGPWRGGYFTGLEGSLRTPFIIRWPGMIPSGQVSNEIVHEIDLFSTLARVAGGKVPSDRMVDSKDMNDFFRGKTEKSPRESVIVYVGKEIFGVKWRNWKMMTKELDEGFGVAKKEYSIPVFYNLHLDPREEYPVMYSLDNYWVRYPAAQKLLEHLRSLEAEPPIDASAGRHKKGD